ncbi:CgeB family protein [Desulfovibrio sp.]
MARTFDYEAQPVIRDGEPADLRVLRGGRTWTLWGRRGGAAELALLESLPDGLPVLLGTGLGLALEALLGRGGPVAVVDREAPLLEASGVRRRFGGDPRVLWLDDPDPAAVLRALDRWRTEHGGRALVPLVVPLWRRLAPDYYGGLLATLRPAPEGDFWSRARRPRFRNAVPRVLVLRRPYFLTGEIASALDALELPWRALEVGMDPTVRPGFVEDLLTTVVEFQPDFALTVNHFGLDREGKVAGLLERLGLPLASWFVDNPRLILSRYAGLNRPGTVLFTWDEAGVEPLRADGYPEVHYLPLATDPARFRPDAGPIPEAWRADVSFVGNSMRRAVDDCLAALARFPELVENHERLAREFGAWRGSAAAVFLAEAAPEAWRRHQALPDEESRLAFESLLTWEATRQYRLECVRGLLPFDPLVAGDEGWRAALGPGTWRWHSSLDYARDLPRFYAAAQINFNCTSRQMKGAVNQRVFDVPACGGFLLTDAGPQLERLFDPGSESAVYHGPEEVEDAARRWLADPLGRAGLARRARARVLAEHTYAHRLRRLVEIMRQTVAGPGEGGLRASDLAGTAGFCDRKKGSTLPAPQEKE